VPLEALLDELEEVPVDALELLDEKPVELADDWEPELLAPEPVAPDAVEPVPVPEDASAELDPVLAARPDEVALALRPTLELDPAIRH
jgi:hypothetical protein